MCDKSCDLLTQFKTNESLLTLALKIYAFFALGSTVIRAVVTSIPRSFGRTIVKTNLKIIDICEVAYENKREDDGELFCK